jgi:Bacteriophage clamp loader A subunit
MADLFKEIVPAILQTKKNVLVTEQDVKSYPPYMVNRALSQHMDCILHVNEMNRNYGLDNDLQFQYYLNSIRPMKRPFQKWAKVENDKDLDAVKEYFGYSNEKAKMALQILNNEQLTYIKNKINKGGVTK